MDALIIAPKSAKGRRIARAFCGLYFLLFCGYLMFNRAVMEQFNMLFFFSLFGAFLALILFLSNTLWISDKILLKIDEVMIESNVKSNKLRIEWVKVSKVAISESEIVFYTDGGQKEKALQLAALPYGDVNAIKEKVIELCEHKNIVVA